jgi:5-enolpyruvylshikimate-3-phosphate synthase
MVVVVCGSRSWTNRDLIRRRLSALRAGSAVITGNLPGADTIAREEAVQLGLEVLPVDAAPTKLPEELIDWLFELTARPEERLALAFHENLAASTDTARTLSIARNRGVTAEVITGEGASTDGW